MEYRKPRRTPRSSRSHQRRERAPPERPPSRRPLNSLIVRIKKASRTEMTFLILINLHMLDNRVTKLGALDFCGMFHQARKVICHRAGLDGAFHAFDD